MKLKSTLTFFAISFVGGVVAMAQSSLVSWDFNNAASGVKDGIAASAVEQGLAVSTLNSTGGVSGIGVIKQTFGATKATGSANFADSAFEVGMDTLRNATNPVSSDYALNFNLTVGAGQLLELSSFSFNLGYDTDYATSAANYYAPFAQLFVSTDGANWLAAGNVQTLAISDPSIFSTGAGSGGVFYIQNGLEITLTETVVGGSISEGATLYFRLALSDEGSGTSRRRVLVDEISLNGNLINIPETSSYALGLGAIALVGCVYARCRRRQA